MKRLLLPIAVAGSTALPNIASAQTSELDALVLSCQLVPEVCIQQLDATLAQNDWSAKETQVFLGLFAGRIVEISQSAPPETKSLFAQVLQRTADLAKPFGGEGARAIRTASRRLGAESDGSDGKRDNHEDGKGDNHETSGGNDGQQGDGNNDDAGGSDEQPGSGSPDLVGACFANPSSCASSVQQVIASSGYGPGDATDLLEGLYHNVVGEVHGGNGDDRQTAVQILTQLADLAGDYNEDLAEQIAQAAVEVENQGDQGGEEPPHEASDE